MKVQHKPMSSLSLLPLLPLEDLNRLKYRTCDLHPFLKKRGCVSAKILLSNIKFTGTAVSTKKPHACPCYYSNIMAIECTHSAMYDLLHDYIDLSTIKDRVRHEDRKFK